jgi:hypothetical protein
MLSAVKLNVNMLSVIMLSVFMLSIVMLSVVQPCWMPSNYFATPVSYSSKLFVTNTPQKKTTVLQGWKF